MQHYNQGLQQDGLEPLPPLTELGAEILEGDPRQSARFDYGSLGTVMAAGIWACTQGKFTAVYPYNEYATILEGSVTITDADGKSVTYNPGDSHFVAKGETVTWDITTPTVKKAFFSHWGDQGENA